LQVHFSCLLKLQGMLPPDLPLISVSKGLEVSTGQMMSEIIPSALQRKQPAVFLSGPSFAREVMELCPTVVVVASKVPCIITAVSATVLLYMNCICHLLGWSEMCHSAGGSCQRVA
jgi:glycerol-3-phosphate dehydrogenase